MKESLKREILALKNMLARKVWSYKSFHVSRIRTYGICAYMYTIYVLHLYELKFYITVELT